MNSILVHNTPAQMDFLGSGPMCEDGKPSDDDTPLVGLVIYGEILSDYVCTWGGRGGEGLWISSIRWLILLHHLVISRKPSATNLSRQLPVNPLHYTTTSVFVSRLLYVSNIWLVSNLEQLLGFRRRPGMQVCAENDKRGRCPMNLPRRNFNIKEGASKLHRGHQLHLILSQDDGS